jgi:hypothetical protein
MSGAQWVDASAYETEHMDKGLNNSLDLLPDYKEHTTYEWPKGKRW